MTFGTPLTLGSFKTTAEFAGTGASAEQQERSASFVDSNVAAANLGAVTLTGVFPDVSTDVLSMLLDASSFGIAFATGPAGSAGTLKLNGSLTATVSPASIAPKFQYQGF